MKFIFSLIAITILLSCQEEIKETIQTDGNKFKEAIVSGRINNRIENDTIKILKVYISDLLAEEQFRIKEVAIDDSGYFKTSLLTNRPQTVSLAYKSIDFQLIVKPEDSINVVFNDSYENKEDAYANAVISGNSEDINSDLFKFLYGRKFNSSAYYNRLKKSNPESYKKYHDSLFSADGQYIDTFIANNKLNKTLVDWLYVEKNYVPADYLLGFPMYYDMFNPNDSKTASYSPSFFNDLKELPKLEAEHLVNTNLNGFGNYLRFHYYKKLRSNDEKVKSKTLDSIAIRELQKDYNGNPLVVELAVYDIINSSLENNSLDFLNNEEQFIEVLYANSIFKPIITSRKETVIALIENPILPKSAELIEFNYDSGEAFINDLVNNTNKKIIYIDNWAVWCAPCRSEFREATPHLKKKFNETVEFVYICHLSEQKLWEPMIAQYNIEGKHYFVTDEQNKMLIDFLKIEGYPNYNIIDQNGDMLFHGFEYRPSEPLTTEILTKLTK